jgi:hypothetical protein
MKNIKISIITLVITVVVIAVVYAGEVLQNRKSPVITTSQKTVATDPKDSVEVIGTPTNDDPWKEVAKLAEAYYTKSGIMYKGAVKVIDDNSDSEKVVEEQPFQYTLLGNDYHYQLGNLEVISKKSFLMVIDHINKTISYTQQLPPVKNRQHKLFDMAAFKKIMLKGKVNARITQAGEDKILTIDSINDAVIQGYRIYYSPHTYRINKMLIGMVRPEPLEKEEAIEEGAEGSSYYYYLDISFNTIETLALKEKIFRPEDEFVIIEDRKIVITPAYKDYQLLNTIQP